jgi:catecholate siderophore receptor
MERTVSLSFTPPILPLGALAAGFGLISATALAQTAPAAPKPETTMQPISVKAQAETDANSVRANTTTIGKGTQDVRDIPQSLTILTEKLFEDRRVETLKQALQQTGGISFQAAEGGEEDVRLRGFSLAASGDIYVDGLRDPAFYDRDTFSYDRLEVLRGSASMLFGRGSTGGVVNQVHKQAFLAAASEVNFSAGSGDYLRFTGDFNLKLGDSSALRINAMKTDATQWGNFVAKQGLAVNLRWNIGGADEFYVAGYYLHNRNGINYGLPWLRQNSAQAGASPSTLIPGLDGRAYYQAASDYNASGAAYATFGTTHRFADGSELKTTLRNGTYDRDLRAGTIRFCVAPACPGFTTPGVDGPVRVSAATPLTRGLNNKVQDLHTTYVQSDYSRRFKGLGLEHELLSGVDLAREERRAYATLLPSGVTLDKNTPRTTLGTPNDGGGFVDEALRIKLKNAGFVAQSTGVYAQDLVQVAESWKLLAGLRYDRFQGRYKTYQTVATATQSVGDVSSDYARTDGLWSRRFGALYQPSDAASFHFSYGTSFNTSGDAFQYDLPGSNTGPESSRNIELGAKLDLFDGRFSLRSALFHTTKFNERNRDSPNNVPITDYLLSGKRHALGVDLDLAGRITAAWEVWGSYTWIPVARIDAGNPLDSSTLTGELVGQRPSLTPRHSGSVWTSYQFTRELRLGAGLNARSSQTPNRNPAGIVAPSFVTGDLLAEFTVSDSLAFKLNVLNVSDKYYADTLYTGHYVPGAPRTVQLTLTARF